MLSPLQYVIYAYVALMFTASTAVITADLLRRLKSRTQYNIFAEFVEAADLEPYYKLATAAELPEEARQNATTLLEEALQKMEKSEFPLGAYTEDQKKRIKLRDALRLIAHSTKLIKGRTGGGAGSVGANPQREVHR